VGYRLKQDSSSKNNWTIVADGSEISDKNIADVGSKSYDGDKEIWNVSKELVLLEEMKCLGVD
jgi:hypothetical protein